MYPDVKGNTIGIVQEILGEGLGALIFILESSYDLVSTWFRGMRKHTYLKGTFNLKRTLLNKIYVITALLAIRI